MKQAKEILKHYFRLLFERASLRWDADNDAEIDTLVELLWSGNESK